MKKWMDVLNMFVTTALVVALVTMSGFGVFSIWTVINGCKL